MAERVNVKNFLTIVKSIFLEKRSSNFETKPIADKQAID